MRARVADAWEAAVEDRHLAAARWVRGIDAGWHLWLRARRKPPLKQRRPLARAGKDAIIESWSVRLPRGWINPRPSCPLTRLAAVAARRSPKPKRRPA